MYSVICNSEYRIYRHSGQFFFMNVCKFCQIKESQWNRALNGVFGDTAKLFRLLTTNCSITHILEELDSCSCNITSWLLQLQLLLREADAGEDYSMDPVLKEACQPVVLTACADIKAGDARYAISFVSCQSKGRLPLLPATWRWQCISSREVS